jgi:hypothetical protein
LRQRGDAIKILTTKKSDILPLMSVSAWAAQHASNEDGEEGGAERCRRPEDQQEAFLAQVAALQASARQRQRSNGRRFWLFASYGILAWFISMHTSGWFSSGIWWVGILWYLSALFAAEAWNAARIEATLSPLE